jgi:hypothetical protein
MSGYPDGSVFIPFFTFVGWGWVHLVRRPLFGLLYQPGWQMSMEYLVEWELAGETEVLEGNLPQCHFVHFFIMILHESLHRVDMAVFRKYILPPLSEWRWTDCTTVRVYMDLGPKDPRGFEPVALYRKSGTADRKNYQMALFRTTLDVEPKKSL